MINWHTETRKIHELRPWDKNPRVMKEKQMADLNRSITKFGLAEPIVINVDNMIIGGHGRYLTLRKKGLGTEVLCMVPNRKLEEKELEELNIRLNKNIAGEFDMDALANNFDVEELMDWGFDEKELLGLDFQGPDDTEIDNIPEIAVDAICKMGDLWVLGDHRLLCGDCTNVQHVEKVMDGNTVDMVFTDPPYGIRVVNTNNNKIGGGGAIKFGTIGGGNIVNSKKYSEIIGDDSTESAKEFYNTCVSLNVQNYVVWGGNYFTEFLPSSPCWVVWDKENNGNNFADIEIAWTNFDKGAKLYHWLWNGMSRKGERGQELKSRVHPTQKPVGLFLEIFKDFEFDTCLDGFGGSGSTLIACEKAKRKCYMMEIDPLYCDVILKRWSDYTHKDPVRDDGKKWSELVK